MFNPQNSLLRNIFEITRLPYPEDRKEQWEALVDYIRTLPPSHAWREWLADIERKLAALN